MHVLFVHRDFPAQFRYVAPRLAAEGWGVTFVTRNAHASDLPGVTRVLYDLPPSPAEGTHPVARGFGNAVGHAMGVYDALKSRPDVKPDLVVAHGSFGSSLFLPYLYDCPVVNFFEYFYRPLGQHLGYRPEIPVTELDLLWCRADNAMTLLDLENCDRAWTPTNYQRDLMPEAYRGKVTAVHDGIDTARFKRREDSPRRLPDGTALSPSTRVVTYVTRGFEMMRGFDVFMAAAKRIAAQYPDVVFALAGGDHVYYGTASQSGRFRTFRERVLATGGFDASRFHFLGVLPEDALVDLLSISDLHVYLTAPFFTSWSPLEAMSCACVMLASDQPCTREYIDDGRNGLLCDFFDADGMALRAVEVLKDPAAFRPLGEAARRTIEQTFSIDATLPRIKAMFEQTAAMGPRTPSVRAELLVRSGKRRGDGARGREADENGRQGEGETRRQGDGEKGGGAGPLVSFSQYLHPESVVPRTVLFCWELGDGNGHLAQMRPLAEDLARAGHRVVVALRNLNAAAARAFEGAGVQFLAAPCWNAGGGPSCRPHPITFTHLLMNVGFGDDAELTARCEAWRNLFRLVGPDLIVTDFSPGAMLASSGLDVRRAAIGSGFCFPLPECEPGRPWAVLRHHAAAQADPQLLLEDERAVLARVNRLLARWKRPPLQHLGTLYAGFDENFLTTFRELDHFARRGESAAYWGPVIGDAAGCVPAQWPGREGKRVLVYLKNRTATPDLLEGFSGGGARVLAFIDGLAPERQRRFESASLHLSDRPVDLRRAAAECDAAVLSGGAGSTAQVLLAGKPVVEVPTALEQCMTADAVQCMGAGVRVTNAADAILAGVEAVTGDEHYANAARRFGERYASFDPDAQRRAMACRASELLSSAARGHAA